jgi:leader peptidase (prepilin peptidase)/N-methyltransferase
METIIIITCFGLAWGSFLNVVIYRLPLRMSLFKPSSSCPHCNEKIKFYDNIPVLSFLLLRGKCRHCKGRIEITLPGLLLALIYSLFRTDLNLRQALIGAVAGAGFLLFIYGAYYLLRKKEGLGLGDVTMMLFIGAYLGWRQAFFTLILASFVGALVGIFFIFCKKKDFQYSLPFGTFLAPTAFAALLWGERIIDAYLSLFKNLTP